jgi:hypothetical protein
MASRMALVAAALAGFVVVLIARLPVRWAAPLLPPQLHCATLAGTVWNGACEGASVQLPGSATQRDLGVIRCEGGSPLRWFDANGLPWRDPSPNMRSLTAATLYPGVGLLEFCKLSVGRGTGTGTIVDSSAGTLVSSVTVPEGDGTGIKAQNRVAVRIMPGQHQHRAFDPLLAHPAAQLTPVGIRKADIKDHQIIMSGFCLFHAFGTRAGFEDVKVLGHDQLFAQRFAKVVVIVHQQNFLEFRHCLAPLLPPVRCARSPGRARFATVSSRARVACGANVSISRHPA